MCLSLKTAKVAVVRHQPFMYLNTKLSNSNKNLEKSNQVFNLS
jgi:hypothetical protein